MNNPKKNDNICFICKSDKIPINIEKIKGQKLKQIIIKINKKDSDPSILINKCNCGNNKQKSHKICLLLNIIFNFDLNCKECKSNYNITISKRINNYKKCCNICSFIFLLLFHICFYGGAAFLILYIHLINKDIKHNFEENKLYHIYYFFAAVIFIINTLIIHVTFSRFIDNNYKDIYNYEIEVKDINEQNKMKNSDKLYEILYKFFRYFYHTQIRYLIDKKQKQIYMSKGYGNFNKDLKEIILKNKEEFKEEKICNNGGKEDILNINKYSKSEKIKNNLLEPSNGIINVEKENIENVPIIKNEEEKNNENFIDKSLSKEEKISKNINSEESIKIFGNINIIENEENLEDKNVLIEPDQILEIESQRKFREKRNSINNEKSKEKNHLSMCSDKIQEQVLAKTYFYKKINNNNLFGKSKTIIDGKKRKRKKSKKEKKGKYLQIQMKISEEERSKKYMDSTLLANSEKDKKSKIEEIKTKNFQLIEDDPFNMIISTPFHNNGK